MRSNGNCRGVSYWESHTGCLHTGDTVRHRLQSTALNQLDIGEAQHRWSCSTIGAPFEPDPVVSVRGLDSKSSLQPAGISRCTSNPGFSRSSLIFFFFCFSVQKSFEGKEGRGLKEEFGEKRERQRKRKKWQERERKGGGGGRGIRRVEKKKKKKEKRKRNNRERERECMAMRGGRRTREEDKDRKGLELWLRWKRDSRWSWNRSIHGSRVDRQLLRLQLELVESRQRASTEKRGAPLCCGSKRRISARTTLFPERSAIISSRARCIRARSTVLCCRAERERERHIYVYTHSHAYSQKGKA